MTDNLGERESDFDISSQGERAIFKPNHALMARPRRREQDGHPQRIFFYRRFTDNQVLILTEQEAAMMEKSSHRGIIQQIGCSDGGAYRKVIEDSGLKVGQVISRKEASDILRRAENAEMESAKGHYARPLPQNQHFDESIPYDKRSGIQFPA
jgi:hypothetical protein